MSGMHSLTEVSQRGVENLIRMSNTGSKEVKLVNKWRSLYLLIAVILLLSSVMVGSTPVFALSSGSATSSAIPSDATPSVGDQIIVDISIDVSDADPPDNSLGSYTGSLDWNPEVLDYQSDSGILAGFTGLVNTADVATGQITFNGANASGARGSITIISITFDVVGSGSSDLDLEYSAMAAASTFTDLLPILTVNDGLVKENTVTEIPTQEIPEKVKSGTGNWWIWVLVGIGVFIIAAAAILIIRIRKAYS